MIPHIPGIQGHAGRQSILRGHIFTDDTRFSFSHGSVQFRNKVRTDLALPFHVHVMQISLGTLHLLRGITVPEPEDGACRLADGEPPSFLKLEEKIDVTTPDVEFPVETAHILERRSADQKAG
jgi:hypothetical protein